jgi:hypothetical protein
MRIMSKAEQAGPFMSQKSYGSASSTLAMGTSQAQKCIWDVGE